MKSHDTPEIVILVTSADRSLRQRRKIQKMRSKRLCTDQIDIYHVVLVAPDTSGKNEAEGEALRP